MLTGRVVSDHPVHGERAHPPSRKPRGVESALRELFSWKTLVVLGAMVLWAYNFHGVEEQIPFLLTAELKVHQVLSNLDWHRKRVGWVTLVEIDDDSFWSPLLSGATPTNRAVLGDLGLLAADYGAVVVAFDIKFNSPTSVPGDFAIRDSDNQYLLKAIRKITAQNKVVVLPAGFVLNDSGEWQREPRIFRDDQLPRGTRTGYINLPIDPRQIPLATTAWQTNEQPQTDAQSQPLLNSFALEIVDSYEEAAHIRDHTKNDPVIEKAIADNEFVYGGFLGDPTWQGDRVTAKQLLEGNQSALEKCRNRIVIFGGTWHAFGYGRGPQADTHSSPLGPLPGLYLHANYVESLLRDDFRPAVSEKIAVLIDVVIAVVFYVLFRSANKRRVKVGVFLTFVFLIAAVYLVFTAVGKYLDFITPVSLVFVHLLVEAF
jgi:CHASE2 domain-containing sensor protein